MKSYKNIFAILILILFLSDVSAQSDWYWQNPLPQGYSIRDGKFLNSSTGFAVGYHTFYKTTDAGINWRTDDLDNGVFFHSLDITNSGIIFIVGSKGKILKSTDLGESWIDKSVDSLIYLNDVFFITENTGYSVGNRILKTINGGNNWIEQAALGTMQAVSFINVNTGMTVGSTQGGDLLFRTTNGGINWISSSNNGLSSSCSDIFLLDENTALVTSQPDIFKTTNGGNNWYSTYLFPGRFRSIYFTSMLKGFAVGRDGLVMRTFDGGEQWYPGYIAPGSPSVASQSNNSNSISFTDSLNGFITGDYGLMYFTSDGGNNWEHQRETINHLNSTYFPDASTGFVCGQNGTLLKTTDSGAEWKLLHTNFNRSFNDLYFIDANTGIVVGDTGIILRTTNGGNNWTQSLSPTLTNITAVSFANQNYGLACSNSGVIIRTTNGGVTWISNPTGIIDPFLDISYPSEDTAYVITLFNLYKSTNKGLNWNIINSSGTSRSFGRMQFFNSSTGIISRNSGFIFNPYKFCKTTNGGASFDTSATGYTYFNFIDMNTGFGAGPINNKVAMTINGGASWSTILTSSQGIDNDFKSVYMINFNTAFLAGEYGAIIKARSIITSVNISGVDNKIDFHLFQNYPNPFNPNTNLEFGISELGFVSLKVYDISGKEVASLVNEVKPAGLYSVSFNGSNLSSGIYFYTIKAGDFVLTKKMTLIK